MVSIFSKIKMMMIFSLLFFSCNESIEKTPNLKTTSDIIQLNMEIDEFSSKLRCYYSEINHQYDYLKYINSLQSQNKEIKKVYDYIDYSRNALGLLYQPDYQYLDSIVTLRENLCDSLWTSIDTNSISQTDLFYSICDELSISDEDLHIPLYK